MSATEYPDLDVREQIARIDRLIVEAAKFREETRRIDAEREKLREETRRIEFEREKLREETRKISRDQTLAPWQIVVTAMGTGGALVALIKVLGG